MNTNPATSQPSPEERPRFATELISEIRLTPVLQAALHHRSANAEVSKMLKALSYPPEVLDVWQRVGEAVVNVWAATTSISAPKNRTAGNASISSRSIFETYVKQIGSAICSSELAIFGAGVTHAEKDASTIYDQLTFQFVGALASTQGLAKTKCKIFDQTLKDFPVAVEAIKDEKTILQEFTQKQKLGLPKYTTLGTTGKGAGQAFRVEVKVKNERTIGVGSSRRVAEKAAAAAFLEKFLPYKRASTSHNISSFDISLAARSIQHRKNLENATAFTNALGLPSWSASLISLAFTHPSYSCHTEKSALGKDNKLLAFVGSYVMLWIIRDCCINSIAIADIIASGGLVSVTTPILQTNVLANGFETLGLERLALLGDGEPVLTSQIKAEILQAFIGALFLARQPGSVSHWHDLFSGIPAAIIFFTNQITSLPKDRNLLIPPKTLFQERCQAIGVSAVYTTQIIKRGTQVAMRPLLRLRSGRLGTQTAIALSYEQTAANLARRKGEYETELASIALRVLTEISGIAEYEQAREIECALGFKQWLLLHTISIATEIAEGQNKRKRSRRTDQILGVKLLQDRNFASFSSWLEKSMVLVGAEHFNTNLLGDFYAHVGITKSLSKVQKNLTRSLRELRELLEGADPLNHDLDIRESQSFDSTVVHATIYRILGSPITRLTLLDLASQAELLLQKSGITVSVDKSLTQELQEVHGAHLALITLITNEKIFSACSKLEFKVEEETLLIAASFAADSLPLSGLVASPLWQALEVILPIRQVECRDHVLWIRIPCISNQGSHDLALRFWLSYNLKGALGTAANDTVATMLHDLKNNMLGYVSASLTAQSVSNVRERYQIANGAVEHLNQALSTLNTVEAFLQSTAQLPLHEINIALFMRSLATNLMSWLPQHISLVMPDKVEDAKVWSNQDRLNSILLNLCRNSAEAMATGGKLTLRAHLANSNNAVEFEITDTGSGFTEGQLLSLNKGAPIRSTKTKGQGIGLLTVLLLIKELNGVISFENIENGSRTSIWVPTTLPSPD